MPQDRTLSILMTFNGYFTGVSPNGQDEYGGRVSYSLTGSSPAIPAGLAVVDPSGKIDVGSWVNNDRANWNDRVDITFSLAGNCTLRNGTVVPVVWSPNMNNDPLGQPAMLLMESDKKTPASPSEVDARWVPGSNNTQILVDDKDESKDYYFRPAIVIPSLGGYYISCDPPLVNRQAIG